MWVTQVHGAGFDLGYVVRDPEAVGEQVYAVAETGLVLYDFAAASPRPLAPEARSGLAAHPGTPCASGGPAGDRGPAARPTAALWPTSGLRRRARTVDGEGAMRLQADGDVLAAWVGVLPASGILAEGTVLGLRTFALAEPVEVDAVVPLGAVADRTAPPGGRPPARPPPARSPPWAAVTPPRTVGAGGTLPGDLLASVARDGQVARWPMPCASGVPRPAFARPTVWARDEACEAAGPAPRPPRGERGRRGPTASAVRAGGAFAGLRPGLPGGEEPPADPGEHDEQLGVSITENADP